jgi:hypothetical protein
MTEPITPTEVPDWVDTPTLTKTDIVDPDGKLTGQITIAYTRGHQAFVTTDDTPLTYRGNAYTLAVHVYRNDDATWSTREPKPIITYHDRYPTKPAAPTYAAAMLAAVTHTVAHYWTPELGRDADYAHAVHRLHSLGRERDTARSELARIEAERTPHLDTVHAYTTEPAEPAT